MHPIQLKLLRLVETFNLGAMALRDIAKFVDQGHPQVIKHHLGQLEKKGHIKWDRESKLIAKISPNPTTNNEFVIIPILGTANCGKALAFADEKIEGHIKVSAVLLSNKRNVFAVRATGFSMNAANINGKSIDDGDFVIIDSGEKNICSNDYVLSIIDEMATIKKIVIDSLHEQICLFSESTYFYPPIYIHSSEASSFLINGKVIQVIKISDNH